MKINANIVADSIGPNGKRVTTLEVIYPKIIHTALWADAPLISRTFSNVTDVDGTLDQVKDYPFIPSIWTNNDRGVLGETESSPATYCWLTARERAVAVSSAMIDNGVSKQLSNRLIEPWVWMRAVVTATEWDGFFMLRHPWHTERKHTDKGPRKSFKSSLETVWESEVNLNFPAELHIQELVICMRKAIQESTPRDLKERDWHLPFLTVEDNKLHALGMSKNTGEEAIQAVNTAAIKLSATRCAYGLTDKTIEEELALAESLMANNHWSPFEHQARATDYPEDWNPGEYMVEDMEDGLEMRSTKENEWSLWSRNLQRWVQARTLLENS